MSDGTAYAPMTTPGAVNFFKRTSLSATKPSTTSNARNPYAHDSVEAADAISWLTSTPPPPAGTQPHFIWLGLLAPHPPYDTNATWLSHLNATAIDAPVLPSWESMHPYDVAMSTYKACTLNYTDSQLRTMRSAYWGAAAEALHLLTLVVAAARRGGWLDNTMILVSADHGEMSMEHRQDL